MIDGLKPYPEYKESDVPWLGQIPLHWAVRRMKYVLREKDARSTEGKEQLLRVSQYTGVTQRLRAENSKAPDTRAESLVGYKKVQPGELVINIMLAWNGSLGVSRYTGIASPAYCVYRFGNETHPWYFHYLLRTPIYKGRIKSVSTGVVESRLRLYSDNLYRLESLVPSPDEQAAIVKFLDHATRRLNRAIRAKQKVIALLNEQKQVIIHRAVTRGLDPDVPLKPSGISLLGYIPKHWEVTSLRRYWQVVDCKHLTVPFSEEGFPLASVVEVQSFYLNLSRCKKTTSDWYRVLIEGGRKPKRGDIIYCRNVSVGASAFVDTDLDFAMGQDVCLIRSNNQNQRFLNYLLRSQFMAHQLELLLVGSTFKRINISEIKSLLVIVPPIKEQNKICRHIDSAIAEFDALITSTERQITLLQEFRTRLIADVVTGKLDVREAARRIPDETEEIEPDMESIEAIEEELQESETMGEAYG